MLPPERSRCRGRRHSPKHARPGKPMITDESTQRAPHSTQRPLTCSGETPLTGSRETSVTTETPTATAHLELAVEGMTCASCVARIERKLGKVPGVAEASVNLATEQAHVRYDPAAVDTAQLIGAIE